MTLIWQPRTVAVVLMAGIALTGCGGKKKADGVQSPVAITVFDTPSKYGTVGQEVALYWRAEYATSCTGSWSGATALPTYGGALVTLPARPGTVTYKLTCSKGELTSESTVSVVAREAESPGTGGSAPVISFTPPAGDVVIGQSSSFSWSAPSAANCSGVSSYPADSTWNGKAFPASGSYQATFGERGAAVYVLKCQDANGNSSTQTLLLNVQDAFSLRFEDGSNLTQTGDDSTDPVRLKWQIHASIDRGSCSASANWAAGFNGQASGTHTLTLPAVGAHTYALSCRSGDSTITHDVRLLVTDSDAGNTTPPPGFDLDDAKDPEVGFDDQGKPWVKLDWTVIGDDIKHCVTYSRTIPAWNDTVKTPAELRAAPVQVSLPTMSDGSHAYDATLICTSNAGVQSSATTGFTVEQGRDGDGKPTLTLSQPVVHFAAMPSRLPAGEELDLAWATSGAGSCSVPPASLAPASVQWNSAALQPKGSQDITAPATPGIYTYSLVCATPGIEQKTRADVYVTAGDVFPRITSFTARHGNDSGTTLQVSAGEEVELVWTAEDALYCRSGDSGISDWHQKQWNGGNGSHTVTVPRSSVSSRYDFTLQCGIPGGSAVARTVTVVTSGISDECGVAGPNQVSEMLDASQVAVTITGAFGPALGLWQNEELMLDGDLDTSARATLPLALLGIGDLYVNVHSKPPYLPLSQLHSLKGGNLRAGFIISNPNPWLSAGVLGLDSMAQITAIGADGGITTGDNDYSVANGIDLSLLHLLNGTEAYFASIPVDATQPFFGVRYRLEGGLLSLAKIRDVHAACVVADLGQ